MAIEILEIHHTGIRIDAAAQKLGAMEGFYTDVLGLARDTGRPTIPGIPGMWINVGEVGQIHLIGGEQPSPMAKGPGQDPTRPHVAFAVADIVATRAELDRLGVSLLDDRSPDQPGLGAALPQRSVRQHGGAAPDRQMPLPGEQSPRFLASTIRKERQHMAASAEPQDYDALVIGAGISGLYQLYRLRELGLRVRVLEAGSGVGGTWYWNRYPGARFDSESYSYGYSFSQELLDEWNWSEHFAPQPETLRYLNFVADKFDLRPDIRFHSRVSAAHYREETGTGTSRSRTAAATGARFLITAIGPLSAPTMPRIEGVETLRGRVLPHRALAA